MTKSSLIIQRIVDGECSFEEQAEMLREFQDDSSEWKTLALALLEEREWSKEIPLATQLSSDSSTASAQRLVLKSKDPFEVSGGWKTPNWLPALAASLLLGLGFYGGTYLRNSADLRGNAGTGTSVVNATPSDRLKADDDSIMKMVVTEPGEEPQEIPIYDQFEYGLLAAREGKAIEQENARLRKKGYELEVLPQYFTGKLGDGRQLVVPVKQVSLKPYGL